MALAIRETDARRHAPRHTLSRPRRVAPCVRGVVRTRHAARAVAHDSAIACLQASGPPDDAVACASVDGDARDLGCWEHRADATGGGPRLAVKDLIDVAGMPTAAGSRTWSRVATADAPCVAALRAAGWAIAGKTHTNEWAFGIDGRNPWRPPCRNPWDPERLPGGSSSGSAVAVATGAADAALGTDTSGSIRVPAALCGVVGLRPTPGRVPRDRVLPLAPTYDVVGVLARDAETVGVVFRAIAERAAGAGRGAGRGEAAPAPPRPAARAERTDARAPVPTAGPAPATAAAGAPPRLGVVTALFADGDPKALATVRAAAARLGTLVDVAIDGLDRAGEIHRVVQHYEAWRSYAATGLPLDDLAPDVAARIAAGRAITDAAYAAAQAERAELAAAIVAATERVDALVAPTAPIVAPPRTTAPEDVRDALLRCVVPFSQAPAPSVSVPCGTVGGLPVGVQLVGRPGGDEALLALAAALPA